MTADEGRRKSTNRASIWANVVLCICILLVLGYGVKRVSEAAGPISLLNPEIKVSPAIEALDDYLRLDNYWFELNQVSNVVAARFTITNGSDAELRDFVISCDYRDREGNYHGRGKWFIYETLGEHHQQNYEVREKRYISHRTTPDSITCRIIDAEILRNATAPEHAGNAH